MALPYPRGCFASAMRFASLIPNSSSTWLPQSAAEWIASAIIALEPVTAAAAPLAIRIPLLAASAYSTARKEEACDMNSPSPRPSPASGEGVRKSVVPHARAAHRLRSGDSFRYPLEGWKAGDEVFGLRNLHGWRASMDFADHCSAAEAFAAKHIEHTLHCFRCAGHKQPAAGLRIGQQGLLDVTVAPEVDVLAVSLPVSARGASLGSGLDHIEHAREQRHLIPAQRRRNS